MPSAFSGYLKPEEHVQESLRSATNWQADRSPSVQRAYRSSRLVFAANDETAEVLRGVGLNREIPVHTEVAVSFEGAAARGEERLAGFSRGKVSGDFVIGAAGRLHYRKGYKLLLEAFARVELSDVTLRIAGDGPQRAELEELARTLGIAERVEFLGRIDYQLMRDFYAGIDLFAFPSFREATGSVAAEALAMGCPVLAFDKFGARQLLGRDSRFLVSCEGSREECVDRYADAMRRLLSSGERPDVCPEELTWDAQCAWLENEYAAASQSEVD